MTIVFDYCTLGVSSGSMKNAPLKSKPLVAVPRSRLPGQHHLHEKSLKQQFSRVSFSWFSPCWLRLETVYIMLKRGPEQGSLCLTTFCSLYVLDFLSLNFTKFPPYRHETVRSKLISRMRCFARDVAIFYRELRLQRHLTDKKC